MCTLADGDTELPLFIIERAVNPQHVARIVVLSLIERPEQLDAGLDRDNLALPGAFRLRGHFTMVVFAAGTSIGFCLAHT